MTEKKRARPRYYAVLRDHSVVEVGSKKELSRGLLGLKSKDVVFVCRGVEIKVEYSTEPAVKLAITK